MLHRWVFENPWPLAIGLAAGGFFWLRRAFWARSRMQAFVGSLALLIAGVVLLFGWRVETPIEKVDRVLDELADAGLRRDVKAIIARIGDRFQHPEASKQRISERLEREFADFRPDSLSFNGRQFRMVGDAVAVDFVAVTGGQYRQIQVQRYVLRVRATFEESAAGWQIVKIQRFEPLGNNGREVPLFAR